MGAPYLWKVPHNPHRTLYIHRSSFHVGLHMIFQLILHHWGYIPESHMCHSLNSLKEVI